MCDYSLVAVASQHARVADRLITAGFRNTSTRGFASTEDIKTAVCLRPGTQLPSGADGQMRGTRANAESYHNFVGQALNVASSSARWHWQQGPD